MTLVDPHNRMCRLERRGEELRIHARRGKDWIGLLLWPAMTLTSAALFYTIGFKVLPQDEGNAATLLFEGFILLPLGLAVLGSIKPFLYALTGRELLVLRKDRLIVIRGPRWFARRTRLRLSRVRQVKYTTKVSGGFPWNVGGCLAFETKKDTLDFAVGIGEPEAQEVLGAVARQCPSLLQEAGAATDAAGDPGVESQGETSAP